MRPAGEAASWCGLDPGWVYSDLLDSIRRHTQCLHRAYDVLHEALLRYVLAHHRRDGIRQPHAYLRTVVGSVLADEHADAARYMAWPEAGPAQGREAPGPFPFDEGVAPSAEHLAELRERLEAVQRILDSLPRRCREVFWLFRVHGYTQPQIAARLGISVNMVERHVMRALLDLRAARELLDP